MSLAISVAALYVVISGNKRNNAEPNALVNADSTANILAALNLCSKQKVIDWSHYSVLAQSMMSIIALPGSVQGLSMLISRASKDLPVCNAFFKNPSDIGAISTQMAHAIIPPEPLPTRTSASTSPPGRSPIPTVSSNSILHRYQKTSHLCRL